MPAGRVFFVGLTQALGVDPVWVGANRLGYLIELADAAAVAAVAPDWPRSPDFRAGGIIVTAAADLGVGADFVSRFFAPAIGVDEDPVTGAAHCGLAPHWCAPGSAAARSSAIRTRREEVSWACR